MFTKELEAIYENLLDKRGRRMNSALVKAQAEIETINREYEAYCEGVYDALRALEKTAGGENP